jgi:hypothetical protein
MSGAVAAVLFAGGSGQVVASLAGTYDVATTYATVPVSISISISLNNDGGVSKITTGGSAPTITNTIPNEWFFPAIGTPGDQHWVRFDQVSGTAFDVGTLATWQALTTLRNVGYSSFTTAGKSGVVRVRVATDSGGTTVVSDGNCTLTRTQSLA